MRTCTGCGRIIGQLRLRAVPTATRCPQCQDAFESSEDLAGRGPWAEARRRAQAAMAELGEMDAIEFLSGRV